MRRTTRTQTVSHISLAPQPRGLRAVYLVEARDDREAKEVSDLFASLGQALQARQLSSGRLVSYAVKTLRDGHRLLSDLEQALRSSFGFVILHRSFDEIIYRIQAGVPDSARR